VIFDGIVSPTRQYLGEFGPFTSYQLKGQKQSPLFLNSPFLSANIWIKVIAPPLTTLLSHPIGNKFGNM